jgi:Penicillin-insensitive murein endopeptidase
MRHALIVATVAAAAALAAFAAGAEPESRSLGFPWDGRLVGGVSLASDGPHFFTWDPIRKRSPDRPGRRFGSGRLIHTLLRVLNGYATAHPDAPRVGIGDLSRQYGGDFGPRFGPPGHASHQNGLDVDVYYPRRDRRERAPVTPRQIDRVLAQALLDRFVSAGAEKIFVGPHTGLEGPEGIVEVLPAYHDNHMHVRLPGDGARPLLLGATRVFALGHGRPAVLAVGCIDGQNDCAGGAVVSRAIQSAPPSRGTLWLVPGLRRGSWRAAVERLIHRLRPQVTVWFQPPGLEQRLPGAHVVDLPAGVLGLRSAGPYVAALHRLAE